LLEPAVLAAPTSPLLRMGPLALCEQCHRPDANAP
jgi:hypothetical protein